jgi:myosin-5
MHVEGGAIQFNQLRVAEQLRYSGVLEAVRVARFGYNIKLTHYEFFTRYKNIANFSVTSTFPSKLTVRDQQSDTLKGFCRQLIDAIINGQSLVSENQIQQLSLQLGLTKIFMKKADLDILESCRFVFPSFAVCSNNTSFASFC